MSSKSLKRRSTSDCLLGGGTVNKAGEEGREEGRRGGWKERERESEEGT